MTKRVINCDSWQHAAADEFSEFIHSAVSLLFFGGIGIAALAAAGVFSDVENKSTPTSSSSSIERVAPQNQSPSQAPTYSPAPVERESAPASSSFSTEAQFYSVKTDEIKNYSVQITPGTYSDTGEVYYRTDWSDGAKADYVFYQNGNVEIYDYDNSGNSDYTSGTWSAFADGVRVMNSTGSFTIFPHTHFKTN